VRTLLVTLLASGLLVAVACDRLPYRNLRVPAEGMEPSIAKGQTVFVRWYGQGRAPAVPRGQVVVYQSPYDSSVLYISRAVAISGDSVEIANGKLLVNDRAVEASYGQCAGAPGTAGDFPKRTVPPGTVFLLGDNWNRSFDSRMFGPLRVGLIGGTWQE
jgi:signal peptidase I